MPVPGIANYDITQSAWAEVLIAAPVPAVCLNHLGCSDNNSIGG